MRRLTAWAFYWAGHAWSKLQIPEKFAGDDGRCEGFWFEVYYWTCYKPYQWLMAMSVKIQGDGPGPWRAPDENRT